jgi:hypothetical protein
MKMKKRDKIVSRLLTALAVAAPAALTMHSCSEISDCSIDGRSMINCTLLRVDPTSSESVRDTLESLTVTALGTDSIILNREASVSSLSLPLSYLNDTTTLVFHYDYDNDPTVSDTVRVCHTNTPFFESLDCGYSVKQAVVAVDHTTLRIDSIRILDVNTNTNGTENLKIYYRYSD